MRQKYLGWQYFKNSLGNSDFLLQFSVLVTQLYPTLCDPMNCSLPGSSVLGISQARNG